MWSSVPQAVPLAVCRMPGTAGTPDRPIRSRDVIVFRPASLGCFRRSAIFGHLRIHSADSAAIRLCSAIFALTRINLIMHPDAR